MDDLVKGELISLMEERAKRLRRNSISRYYPDDGPLRRELYPKHLEFFQAGTSYRQRLMLAANRVGKTEGVGLYELTHHLTGEYPAWWAGRRFTQPIKAWACGDTSETCREILQAKLLGDPDDWGTGLIPHRLIVDVVPGRGVSGTVDTILVKHVSGGTSRVMFKSYDQKRKAFQGTEQDVILLDEEPPYEIYVECLVRTMTNDGIILATFTPLLGLSETVRAFLPSGKLGDEVQTGKYVVMATWDDVPHLTKKDKDELWASIPPFQRDARSKGIPQLGAGAIYPIPESDIVVPTFEVPESWKRCFGMDVGWNRTAVVWLAQNPDDQVWYVYSEHYRGQAEPVVHAEAIKARGFWIPGACDPAAHGRAQADGVRLIDKYRELMIDLSPAANAVETGIYQVWELFSAGQLKVMSSCTNLLSEYRIYRRDEKGRIVKQNDHAMDALRYAVMTGRDIAKHAPRRRVVNTHGAPTWMG